MSGPKVVRIVTREERLAQSMAIAIRLQQALDRWRTGAQQAGEFSAEEEAQMLERQAAIGQVLAADHFDQFNQQADREIAFLAADLEQRRERAAARGSDERKAQLRRVENARSLVQALKSRGLALEPQGMQILESAAAGQVQTLAAEAALAAGFRLLAPSQQAPALSQAQKQLAERLADEGSDRSFAQWQAAQAAVVGDPRLESLARQLEMLRLLGADAAVMAALEQRVDQCLATSASAWASIKLDSLTVELAAAIRAARQLNAWLDEATAVLAQLAILGSAQAAQVQAQLQTAIAERSEPSLQQALEAGSRVLAASAKAEAARARRTAVLHNLASLGYAVHEGMETAWVEAGRIVVHKPSLDGYGVELSGAPDAQRMQVRTVAFADDRDTSRDIDAEHLWCGDFDLLKGRLAQQGTNVVVERALGVGSVALKRAHDPLAGESRVAAQNTRAAP